MDGRLRRWALRAVLFVSWWATIQGVSAAATTAATTPKPWTVDDILLAEGVGEIEVAPDGSAVVFVKTAMDKQKGERVSNLVLVRLAGSPEPIELTRGKERWLSPKWAPDSQRIAALSDRPSPKDENEEKAEESERAPERRPRRSSGS